jgi:hypothetical protein
MGIKNPITIFNASITTIVLVPTVLRGNPYRS